ncbi:MAG TPA: ATP-dependent DNA ligase [Vicinamibacterales bacterium]|nr:ATP-dependent DNA ligase [Vicinamibacterales bacterium]
MRLAELVAVSHAVAATSGRLEKIAHLSDLLQRVPHDLIPIVVPFLSGALRQGRIGVGGALLTGLRDVPPAAAASLDVAEVDAAFDRVAAASGAGSARPRAELLRQLLGRATRDEQDFLGRLLFGELRQGALEGVLVEAVARAGGVDAAHVRRAAMLAGDLAPVASALLADRDQSLSRFILQPFQPVQPMLADSAADVVEALTIVGDASFEHKLDGARIQVHKAGDEVKIYSRNLRDVTPAVPEIVAIARALPARAIVLDGEAIAMRPDGRPHPFQITMRRFGSRLDVDRLRHELPITACFFDALYLDGDPLIDEPLVRRARVLDATVAAAHLVPRIVTADPQRAAAFAAQAIAAGHEGVMAKAIDGVYAAGRRGQTWLKVKHARTLDLVILAAEWGSGRRRGTLSNLHLGARDPEHGGFVMLGKTFKGMTDEMLAWQTKRFLELEIARDGHTVFVRPEVVAEIAFNEIQDSSQYPGGVALRFARVKRYRSDKTAAEADTIATVRQMQLR